MNLRRIYKFFTQLRLKQQLNYIHYRLSGKKAVVGYQPVTLSFIISPDCNLECDICSIHGPQMPDGYPYGQKETVMLPVELFKNVVDRYDRALRVELIGGGEPLLHPEWETLVGYARSKKMITTIHSNGVLLDDDMISRIFASGLNNFGVSLNAPDAERYAEYTGNPPETFDRITGNLAKLLTRRRAEKRQLNVPVSFVVGKRNYRQMPEMIEKARSLGVDAVLFFNFLPILLDGYRTLDRTMSDRDEEAVAFVRDLARQCGPGDDMPVILPTLLHSAKSSQQFCCETFFYQLRVDGCGRIGSCSVNNLALPEEYFDPAKDNFNIDYFKKKREIVLANDLTELTEICHDCPENFPLRL